MQPATPGQTVETCNLSKRQGVDLVLEANDDWKIQEIGYDGVERYLKPETFTDHVGKLARKVEWKALVGSRSPYENSKVDPEVELDDENVAKGGTNVELVMPEAGPWSFVAKQLHESLNQLNILLDDMSVMKSTDYMKALTVLDPIEVSEPPPEFVTTNRGTQWIWKRRALQEAVQVLDTANRQRQRATSNFGLSADYIAHLQRTKFFEELKEMRETWRIRKTGDYIYGDLSYHIFGFKYDTPNIFDITRRQLSNTMESTDTSIIEVSVPKDLARRSMLAVSVVKDDIESGSLLRNPQDKKYTYAYKEADADKIKAINWKSSLKWAQQTLLLRDTFNGLCKDAVQLRNRRSIIRDNVLLISLFDDYLLRFELQWFPFESGEIKEEGDIYLNRALREMIIGFQCTKFIRPQFFCSMPVTHLPENLDLRGCGGYTEPQIEERAVRPRSILERILEIAAHHKLVQIVGNVAETVGKNLDPVVQHRWLNCGRNYSRLLFNIFSKDYEPYSGQVKSSFFIHVNAEDVEVELKEGLSMKCQKDPSRIHYAIQHAICCFSVTIVSGVARSPWFTPFQTMYANVSALDAAGAPAPTIILCNQAASRSVLFVFKVGCDPEIMVRKFVVNENTAKPEEHRWRKLNYQKLHGSTLCKKVDALLSYLRDG